MSRVLIAGCGYVGTALARELVRTQHEVVGLRRDPSSLPEGVTRFAADLLDPRTLRTLPGDIDALVYCAGARDGSDEAYVDAYLRGLDHVLDACAEAGAPVERVVFTSSTAVYGQTDGSVVDESSPTTPDHHSGQRLLEAEAMLQASPFPSVTARLGGIYGPERTRLIDSVRGGRARRPSASCWTNRVHRSDCAGALAHLLALPAPDPAYIVVDDEPVELADVLDWMARELDVPAAEAGPANDERRRRTNKRCSNAKLRASGYAFRFPSYRDGYGGLLAGGDKVDRLRP